ncbi:MAG: PHP domain-containing protein [Elusimicrobia bacterium]|nr:PHP domain-containing protein [Elusimicrobiota bacterium]
MRRLDLHTHSRYSDGTATPAEVVRRARAAGVAVMVLSDHDTIGGYAEASDAAKEAGITLRCGVEINTCEDDHLHILGYHIDPGSSALAARLEEFRRRRNSRILKIVEKLQAAGIDITFEDIRGVSLEALGRPHVADAMTRKGIVRSRKEAFDRYLVRGKPGYVPPMGPTAQEAIEAIKTAGGWASLAHPGSHEHGGRLKRLKGFGLEGVEAYYPTHSFENTQNLLQLAREQSLQPTVGSDFHGPGTGRDRIGTFEVEDGLFEQLAERL